MAIWYPHVYNQQDELSWLFTYPIEPYNEQDIPA